MSIQDTEIIQWAQDDYENDEHQIFTLDNADDDGHASCPVVERVEGGAWILARVWVEVDWASFEG